MSCDWYGGGNVPRERALSVGPIGMSVCRLVKPGTGASSVLVSMYGFLYSTGDLGRREPWCELLLLREEVTLPSET